jgi:hypothetical protein
VGRFLDIVPETRIGSGKGSQEFVQVGDGESRPNRGRNWCDLTRGFAVAFDHELLAPIDDAIHHIGKGANHLEAGILIFT